MMLLHHQVMVPLLLLPVDHRRVVAMQLLPRMKAMAPLLPPEGHRRVVAMRLRRQALLLARPTPTPLAVGLLRDAAGHLLGEGPQLRLRRKLRPCPWLRPRQLRLCPWLHPCPRLRPCPRRLRPCLRQRPCQCKRPYPRLHPCP